MRAAAAPPPEEAQQLLLAASAQHLELHHRGVTIYPAFPTVAEFCVDSCAAAGCISRRQCLLGCRYQCVHCRRRDGRSSSVRVSGTEPWSCSGRPRGVVVLRPRRIAPMIERVHHPGMVHEGALPEVEPQQLASIAMRLFAEMGEPWPSSPVPEVSTETSPFRDDPTAEKTLRTWVDGARSIRCARTRLSTPAATWPAACRSRRSRCRRQWRTRSSRACQWKWAFTPRS